MIRFESVANHAGVRMYAQPGSSWECVRYVLSALSPPTRSESGPDPGASSCPRNAPNAGRRS